MMHVKPENLAMHLFYNDDVHLAWQAQFAFRLCFGYTNGHLSLQISELLKFSLMELASTALDNEPIGILTYFWSVCDIEARMGT